MSFIKSLFESISPFKTDDLPNTTKKLEILKPIKIEKQISFILKIEENKIKISPNIIDIKDLFESSTEKVDLNYNYVIKEMIIVKYINKSNIQIPLEFKFRFLDDNPIYTKKINLNQGEFNYIKDNIIFSYPFNQQNIMEIYTRYRKNILDSKEKILFLNEEQKVLQIPIDSYFYSLYRLYYDDNCKTAQNCGINGKMLYNKHTPNFVKLSKEAYTKYVSTHRTTIYNYIKLIDLNNSKIFIDIQQDENLIHLFKQNNQEYMICNVSIENQFFRYDDLKDVIDEKQIDIIDEKIYYNSIIPSNTTTKLTSDIKQEIINKTFNN
jgi:hypothetical protein